MKQRIKFIFTTWFIAISLFTINAQDVQTNKNDMENLNLTNEWDKTFPQSDKVKHSKVTFRNRYGITLAADLYMPKNAEGKLNSFVFRTESINENALPVKGKVHCFRQPLTESNSRDR